MKDRIEKRVELKAAPSIVWQALTNYHAFGEWFGVEVSKPFVTGQITCGKLTYPGYENYPWEVVVQTMKPDSLFSFTWHPYAVDLQKDYSKEMPTLVEFNLQATKKGTLLTITESGFEKIPSERRLEAIEMNDKGWTEQLKNIESYLAKKM